MSGERFVNPNRSRRKAARTEEGRWDQAVDRILNSGLMAPYVDDFFKFIDGEISYPEFDERMSP